MQENSKTRQQQSYDCFGQESRLTANHFCQLVSNGFREYSCKTPQKLTRVKGINKITTNIFIRHGLTQEQKSPDHQRSSCNESCTQKKSPDRINTWWVGLTSLDMWMKFMLGPACDLSKDRSYYCTWLTHWQGNQRAVMLWNWKYPDFIFRNLENHPINNLSRTI